jgi:hypothetical protein
MELRLRSFAIGITFFHLDGNFRLCFLSSVGVNEPTQIMFQHLQLRVQTVTTKRIGAISIIETGSRSFLFR